MNDGPILRAIGSRRQSTQCMDLVIQVTGVQAAPSAGIDEPLVTDWIDAVDTPAVRMVA